MPVILSLVALVVAVAGSALAHRRHQLLQRRLEAAIREADQRFAVAVAESTDRIAASVRASIDEARVHQCQTTEDALGSWSTELVAEIDALLDAFRATLKADAAAIVGQALAEYERSAEDP